MQVDIQKYYIPLLHGHASWVYVAFCIPQRVYYNLQAEELEVSPLD